MRWLVATVAFATGAGLAVTATTAPATASEKSVATPVAASPPGSGAPLGPAAVAIARDHVRAHAGDLGLSAADVEDLAVSSVVPTAHNGVTNVYFQQRLESIEISTAMLNVAVRSNGKVLRVASSAVPSAAKRANPAEPKITAVNAAERAAEALGLRPTESFSSSDRPSGPDRERTLGDGGISREPITARLVYQLTHGDDLRLAWELGIDQLDGQHYWQIRMDAANGAKLGASDWVAEDSHNVYPLPTEAPSFGGRVLVSDPADATASPFGWNDTNGAAGAESTLTVGNNVRAYTDLDNNNSPDAGGSPDGGPGLVFDFPLDTTQPPSAYRPAAVANLYFTSNRLHDILYAYGFDEPAGSFQVNNYGRGGLGGDPVNAEAQDGGGTNNANFLTLPDGQSPRMQMYVWTAPTPDRDGDLDNGIIVHEYGHGLSNRLTGGPANVSCLQNQEQGGEGWSDYLAYMLTMPNGIEPAGGRGIGTYALDEPTTGPGIRTQKYSTDPAINNLTYDSIKTMAVPHGVGEVWAEMLWELTYALIAEHGFSSDLINGDAGNTRSLQLVIDGMKLQPCSPGFVDARDAILAADQVSSGGADHCLIWSAFAKRGLGFGADQGSSGSRTDGTQSFDMPPACGGVELTVTASPDPVPAGEQLTYDLHLVNHSPESGGVTGVSVTSELGQHVSFVPGSANCGGTFDAGTRTVTFPIGTMALGDTRDCEFRAAVDDGSFSTTTFEDDFEPDLSGWVASHGAGSVDWSLTTTDPHSPSHAAFASEPATVADQYLTMAAPVRVATGESLSFWHKRGFESGFDGGVVEVSTDAGATWADLGGAAFGENGYNGVISTSFGSPIAGRQAFTGSSPYVKSVASLAAFVGQDVLIRFRAASDSSVAGGGWTVDDVQIGKEVVTTASFTTAATGLGSHTQDVSTRIVQPISVPGPPTVTGSVPSGGAVEVAFAPSAEGADSITGYTAQCTSTDGGTSRTQQGTASPITVVGLTGNKHYRCRVRATNAAGSGPYGGYGATVLVPLTAPAAPTVTGSTPSGGQVKVTFAPGADGGSPITGYTAQCTSTDGGTTRAKHGAASPITVVGLTGDKHYRCRVRATNTAGSGPYGAYGATVLVPLTVPGRPTVTGSDPSGGAVEVSFTPNGDGGSPITKFTARCVSTDGGVTKARQGTTSPITVIGLTGNKHYRCHVKATNVAGTSKYGGYGSTVLVPLTAPASPTVTGSTPSAGQVRVAFTPNADGGSAITKFTVRCVSTNGGTTRAKNGTASPITVPSLTSGKRYKCQVRATNAVGVGPYSDYGRTVLVS